MRPLAEFLLRWDRRQGAVEGPLPTTAACLSNIPVCGLCRENAKQRLLLCCWACGCVRIEWKHSWLLSVEGLVGTTVQQYGGQCWQARVVDFTAYRPNDHDIIKTILSCFSPLSHEETSMPVNQGNYIFDCYVDATRMCRSWCCLRQDVWLSKSFVNGFLLICVTPLAMSVLLAGC